MTWKIKKLKHGTNTFLVKEFKFKNFIESLSFVNKVGEIAENLGHHPEIKICYNIVYLSTTTHDEGGVISQRDYDLAGLIETLSNN